MFRVDVSHIAEKNPLRDVVENYKDTIFSKPQGVRSCNFSLIKRTCIIVL
jgi:hypothetical protein